MDRRIAFGRRLKTIRKILGFSQERLAELACLHRTYIGGVERGERNVSLVNIWRIAEALEIHPSELFAAPGEPTAAGLLRGARSVLAAKATPRKGATWTKRRKQ